MGKASSTITLLPLIFLLPFSTLVVTGTSVSPTCTSATRRPATRISRPSLGRPSHTLQRRAVASTLAAQFPALNRLYISAAHIDMYLNGIVPLVNMRGSGNSFFHVADGSLLSWP